MAPKVGAGGVGSGLATTTGGMVPSALAGGDTDDESAGDGSKKTGSSKMGGAAALAGSAHLPNALTFGPTTSASGKRIETERCTRWAELLCNRPSTGDSNAMSAWLLEVLAVSDLEKPLGSKGTDTNRSASGVGDVGDIGKTNVASNMDNGNTGEASEAPSTCTDKEVLKLPPAAGTSLPAGKAQPEDNKEVAATPSVLQKEAGDDSASAFVVLPQEELSKKRERSGEVESRPTKDRVEAKKAKTSEGEKQAEEAQKDT